MITAKKTHNEKDNSVDYEFELWEEEQVKTQTGEVVTVERLVGTSDLDSLVSEKEMLQKQIDKINEKITAIENAKNEK